jgi:formate--tetrahydrofolate ligase
MIGKGSDGEPSRRVTDVAKDLGLDPESLLLHGHYIAKVPIEELKRREDRPDGALVLVTAMTPTPHGEGKTTTTIGLGDALRHLGRKAAICLREPSLGP